MHRHVATSLGIVLFAVVAGSVLLAWAPKQAVTADFGSDPDLALNLYKDPDDSDPFARDNEITYELYLVNWSMVSAGDVIVTFTLPEHTTYVASSGPGFGLVQEGPDEVIWYRNHLDDFERAWLNVTVRVNADAPVGAGVEASASTWTLDRESNYDNNSAMVKYCVWPAEADLLVTQHLWPGSAPVSAGNELVYELAVQNRGGSVANSVRITSTLPAECTYTSDNPAASGFVTAQTGQTVVWTRASMPPAENGEDSEALFVHCQLANDWTIDRWLEATAQVGSVGTEYTLDNNQVRWTHKPESDRRYGAAITALDDRTFRLLNQAGMDYGLYYLDWSLTEPADNATYWDNLDAAVWLAWQYNVRLVVRVDRAPDWARSAGSATAPPSNPASLGEFVQAAAARWPRQVDHPERPQVYGYVIWNEPNLAVEWGGNAPDAAAYSALLEAAYNGIKAASADAWVISAGLATTGDDPPTAVDDRTYLQALYDAGFDSYCDYLGANPLGFASAPDDASDSNGYNFGRVLEWRQIMVNNGDSARTMWGTEMGWLRDSAHDLGADYNWIKVSDRDQAHYLARAYHKARCEWAWMGPMMAWNLDFAAADDYATADHAYWFAIADETREPLRSYSTLQNAALNGAGDLWLDMLLLDAVQFDQDFRYVLCYTNIGGQPAAGVALTDTLPAGTEYVSDTGGGVYDTENRQVVWDLGTVDPCTYGTITLTLTLPASSRSDEPLVNQAAVSGVPGELYSDDNASEVSTAHPTAVTVGSFSARLQGRAVLLTWETASEGDLLGFYLYRGDTPDGLPAPLHETLIPS